jgi:ATP-dependent DNA ligase
VTLPLKPPLQPQLARSAKELPEGDDWRYEPKFDGFRTIVFRDGDDVQLQSRNGRPMNRYFPDVVEQVLELTSDRLVLDGEMMVVVDGVQEFDLLSQRIHPAASRVERLRKETPASLVAFDLLAEGDEELLALPYDERRERLRAVVADPVQLTPMTPDRDAAGEWLTGLSEGVVAKQGDAPYRPGERTGMMKIKRVRTIDAVVMGWRPGKEEGTVGSFILGLYNDAGQLHPVGHTSGFSAKEKRELPAKLKPYETGKRGMGDPSRWANDRELEWIELRPELVVEVTFDHTSNDRIRHGAKITRWREDKPPAECLQDQLLS